MHRAMGAKHPRNIALACGHAESLAQLHRDEQTAWCPLCEADVQVGILPDDVEFKDDGQPNGLDTWDF